MKRPSFFPLLAGEWHFVDVGREDDITPPVSDMDTRYAFSFPAPVFSLRSRTVDVSIGGHVSILAESRDRYLQQQQQAISQRSFSALTASL